MTTTPRINTYHIATRGQLAGFSSHSGLKYAGSVQAPNPRAALIPARALPGIAPSDHVEVLGEPSAFSAGTPIRGFAMPRYRDVLATQARCLIDGSAALSILAAIGVLCFAFGGGA